MRINLEKLTDILAKIDIEITGLELSDYVTKAYKTISNNIDIRGFRRGKVPKSIIDSTIGKDAVLEQAIAESMDDFYQKAIEEKKITPIGKPEADIKERPNAKTLEGVLKLQITVDIKPAISLPDYKGMTIELKEETENEQEMLNNQLNILRKKFATLSDPIDKQITKGDYVVINLTAKIDGKIVDSATNTTYEAGSGSLLEGLDDAIYTLTPGEDAIFNSTLLGGSHAGQNAEITVEILKICNLILPDLDDDFAKNASGLSTLNELKAHIKTNVESRILSNQFNEASKYALDMLVEKCGTILIPDSLLSQQQEQGQQGPPSAQKNKTKEEDLRDFYRRQFILDAIVEKENIKLTDSDINGYIHSMASAYGINPQVVMDSFIKDNKIAELNAEILRYKAQRVLVASLNIRDASGSMINFDKLLPGQEK